MDNPFGCPEVSKEEQKKLRLWNSNRGGREMFYVYHAKREFETLENTTIPPTGESMRRKN